MELKYLDNSNFARFFNKKSGNFFLGTLKKDQQGNKDLYDLSGKRLNIGNLRTGREGEKYYLFAENSVLYYTKINSLKGREFQQNLALHFWKVFAKYFHINLSDINLEQKYLKKVLGNKLPIKDTFILLSLHIAKLKSILEEQNQLRQKKYTESENHIEEINDTNPNLLFNQINQHEIKTDPVNEENRKRKEKKNISEIQWKIFPFLWELGKGCVYFVCQGAYELFVLELNINNSNLLINIQLKNQIQLDFFSQNSELLKEVERAVKSENLNHQYNIIYHFSEFEDWGSLFLCLNEESQLNILA